MHLFRSLSMTVFRNSLLWGLLLFSFSINYAQESEKILGNAFIGSFHLSKYMRDSDFQESIWNYGTSIEYRSEIDKLNEDFSLTLGIGIETIPLKQVRENDDFYKEIKFNLTLPLGIYRRFGTSYYAGIFTSIDVPFFERQRSKNGNLEFKNSEFTLRLLNVNFSGGFVVGRTFKSNQRQFILELNYKLLALIGNKSNDYWPYAEENFPQVMGLRFGMSI